MGGTLKRRAARALLWAVSCALAIAVPLGLSLLSQWFVLFVWREGYHDPLTFLIFGCLPVYLGVPALMFRYAKRHRTDRAGKWKVVICFVGIVVIFGGLFSGVMFGTTYGDQQMLHDRGVTATGVVTKLEYVRGDSGFSGVETNVRLGDGKTISIFADVDGHPQVGSTVQVTSDPLGGADPQLGPRPPAPGARGEKVSLAIVIVGHIMTASSIVGPLGEAVDPRRLRRRRTPADGKPSYELDPTPEG
ncbi:hypothetical protein ACIRVK_39960 [Streptomyces sp. NPDC101152]|uniref:hypothetical protein n=1 Tax=Streptomyces sp. NPDC101152 TaxID=3366116 RepID=UPI00382384AE